MRPASRDQRCLFHFLRGALLPAQQHVQGTGRAAPGKEDGSMLGMLGTSRNGWSSQWVLGVQIWISVDCDFPRHKAYGSKLDFSCFDAATNRKKTLVFLHT
ncbi:hypothetical protein FKM82_005259 [Ascaphus truei]